MKDFTRELATLSAEQAELLEALLEQAARDGARTPPGATTPRLVPIQNGAARPPLFLIHGSGGQVLFLHALARHMSAAQPVYGIEAAASGGAAPPRQAASRDYAEAIRAHQPHGPYWLGGYSAGCLIAFEAAAALLKAGEEVAFLLMIDPVAVPGAAATERPQSPLERLQRRFEIAMLAGVTPLSPEFCAIEQVNRDVAALARNFRAEPAALRIHVIHGTRGAYVPSAAALQRWAELAGGGLVSAAIDADHFEIVREPHAGATARQLQCWLDALQDAPA